MKSKPQISLTINQLLTCIFIVSGISLMAQANLSDPISVTDYDDSYNNRGPRISVNSNGEPLVFWMDNSSDAMFISTLQNGAFTSPFPIPLNGINPDLWFGSLGPNMVSSGAHIYVVFEKYGEAVYISHSGDDGQTWDNPVPAYIPPNDRRATIPIVGVSSDGHPYVAYINTDINEENAHYGFVKSTDFGQTFTEEIVISDAADGDEVCECCNGNMAVAQNGDIYVAFRNNDNNERDMWLVRSTDGGATFSSAFDVDETDWIAQVCPSSGPNLAILENEVVTAFFSGGGSGINSVFYSGFDIASSVVSSTQSLDMTDESSFGQNRPKVSGGGNIVGAVWQESFDGDFDIAMSISTNGSEGLNTNNFRIAEMVGPQQHPDIFYDGNSFHVVYKEDESGTVFYQNVSTSANAISGIENSPFIMGPNPNEGLLKIELRENALGNITITDALGKIVHQQKLTGKKIQLDISGLDPGVYLVTLGKNRNAQKLVVQ